MNGFSEMESSRDGHLPLFGRRPEVTTPARLPGFSPAARMSLFFPDLNKGHSREHRRTNHSSQQKKVVHTDLNSGIFLVTVFYHRRGGKRDTENGRSFDVNSDTRPTPSSRVSIHSGAESSWSRAILNQARRLESGKLPAFETRVTRRLFCAQTTRPFRRLRYSALSSERQEWPSERKIR